MGATREMAIELTYFNIEGVAEKIRLALKIGGKEFVDKRITFDEWGPMKPTTKFGQLPLMTIDGGEPIAQSGAMLRYAGAISGLIPEGVMAQLRCDECIGLEEDIAKMIAPSMYIGMRPQNFGYPEDMSKEDKTEIQLRLRAKLMEGDLPRLLAGLEGLLVANGTGWFAGDKVSIADCHVVPRIRHFKKGILDGIPSDIVDGYPKLTEWYERFMAIPQVAAHYDDGSQKA